MKACLRCRRRLPVSDYAYEGTAHHCDDCRETLTDEDRRLARLESRRAWRARNLARVREAGRAYWRRRVYTQIVDN